MRTLHRRDNGGGMHWKRAALKRNACWPVGVNDELPYRAIIPCCIAGNRSATGEKKYLDDEF